MEKGERNNDVQRPGPHCVLVCVCVSVCARAGVGFSHVAFEQVLVCLLSIWTVLSVPL